MFNRSMNPKDIVNLLGKLKTKTPDYPTDMMAARKAAFMKQVVSINVQPPQGPGSNAGGSSSSSGAGAGSGGGASGGTGLFGGLTAAQGILLQATIGVWIVAAMLTTAYVFRDQIAKLLRDNGIADVQIMQEVPAIETASPVIASPTTETPPTTEVPPTPAGLTSGDSQNEGIATEAPPATQAPPTQAPPTDDKNGLHLGQTPGTPNSPGRSTPSPKDTKTPKEKTK